MNSYRDFVSIINLLLSLHNSRFLQLFINSVFILLLTGRQLKELLSENKKSALYLFLLFDLIFY